MKLSIVTQDAVAGMFSTARVTETIEIDEKRKAIGIVLAEFAPDSDGTKRVSGEFLPVIGVDDMNNLSGKLMTLIDATFVDKEQRKAMKDLFTQTAWGWYHDRESRLYKAYDNFENETTLEQTPRINK